MRAVEFAGEGGFVAGEDVESRFAFGEGAGDGRVDGGLGVARGDGADAGVEEAGFDAGAAVAADLDFGEAFDEDGFVGRGGVPGSGEVLDESGEEVEVFAEGGEVFGGEGNNILDNSSILP
ncbi:MAG: hypothetical protein ABI972_23740 [Acidobacteriota bacterium]